MNKHKLFTVCIYTNKTWNQIYENMAWAGLTGTQAGVNYLNNPDNLITYELQNTAVAVNSNDIQNCN